MTKQDCIVEEEDVYSAIMAEVLKSVSTKALVKELIKREGVVYERVAPYEPVTAYFINTGDFTNTADNCKTGPCILIKVVD